MTWSFPSYAIFFITAGVIAFILAGYVWTRRASPGARPFALFLAAAGWWEIMRALEAAANPAWAKVLWACFEYPGIFSVGLLFLFFALTYTRAHLPFPPRRLAFLWIVPAVTVALAFTNTWHGLIWPTIEVNPAAPDNLIYGHGAWFWVASAFNFLTMAAGMVVLVRAAVRHPEIYRKQVAALLAGLAIPVIANLIYLAGLSPVRGLDLTPFGMTLTGLVYTFTLYRTGLFQVIPVARDALVELMPDGVIALDPSGRVVDLNPAARRMLGLEAGQAGADLRQLWKNCPEQVFDAGWDKVALVREARGGAEMVLEVRGQAVKGRDGKAAGHLVVLHDVTRREQDKQARVETLRQYRLLADNIQDVVILTDNDLRPLYVSPSVSRLLGYSAEEARRRFLGTLVAGASREKWEHALAEQRLAAQWAHAGPFSSITLEMDMVRQDGSTVPVEIKFGAVRGEDGSMAGFLGVIRDITEWKLAQDRIIEEARARGIFINTLAHEMKTPLTPVLASLDLLNERLGRGGDETLARLAGNAFTGARTLSARLEHLLELAFIDRGLMTLHKQELDIGEMLESVAARLRPAAAARRLALVLDLEKGLPRLKADPRRIEQALLYILEDACKYSPEGGEISLRASAAPGEARVEIHSANELTPEEQQRILKSYHLFQQDRQRLPGIGLGFEISRHLIEAHGGRLWLTSAPGRGSTTGFSLPTGERPDA